MHRVCLVVAGLLVAAVALSAQAQPTTAAPAPAPGFVDPAKPNAPPEPEGMTPLFNGKDLTGWDGDPRLWSVKDGVIRGETTKDNPAKGNTFLICKAGEFGDFELRFSFRCNAANNSGIQYRSKHVPPKETDANKWVVGGYQGEIRNETKPPSLSGFIYDERGKRGRLCLVGEKAVWKDKKEVVGSVGDANAIAASFKLNDWNDYTIIAKGSNIKQYVNGVQTVDFTDESPDLALKKGILALQIHGGNPMWVEFKNTRIKGYDEKK